jgi:hypothetical protein
MNVASLEHDPGTCDKCGRFDAVEFGERRLCPDCIANIGSCCQECEMDDDMAGGESPATPVQSENGR